MTDPDWPNLVTLFFEQAKRLKDKPFVWQKKHDQFEATSWKEAARVVTCLGRALRSKGICAGERVVLVSENRSEWGLADLAIMSIGAISVPAYTTNTINDHRHILHNSQAKAAIVSTQKLANTFFHATHDAPEIEFVLCIEEIALQQEISHPLYQWQEMLDIGEKLQDDIEGEARKIDRDQTACLIYTSGTGGAPKGVMLAHRAILHNCFGASALLESIGLDDEVFLSFLPLSHSYEHTAGLMWPIYLGAQIYYGQGVETLSADMMHCQPTLMTAVPRLYEMMRTRILRGVEQQGGLKERLFHKTHQLGKAKHLGHPKLGLYETIQNSILERLVRQKVRTRFGGRLKALVSGGAPLNPEIGLFFQALGVRILQGYGLTEAGPVISVNAPRKIKMHTVGPLLAQTEVKIAADGEILVRGDLLMQGYWRNEKATHEVLKQGWLYTGDIGFLDEDNYLQITDRKKDIIVNCGGDNVAPQRIEGFLSLEPEIAQSMVYGDQRPHLVALLIMDPDFSENWARENNKSDDLTTLAQDPAYIKTMQEVVSRVNAELSNIEKIRKFILSPTPFTIENEQMTPTLKIRRHVIKVQYEDRLRELYSSIS